MYGRALKLIREYHRRSQLDVAQSLGISRSYLSEIESGLKNPSIEILERYSEVFNMPISSLMLFSEAAGQPNTADRVRQFAADKALKILEWLEDTSVVGGQNASDAKASGLLPVRDRLTRRSGPTVRNDRP